MKTICLTTALLCGFVLSASPARADGKDFHDQELNGKDFKQASLSGADFTDATLRGTDFTGATLKGAVFKGADLTNTVFNSTDLTGANFVGAVFASQQWATFNEANLAKANFEGCDMSNQGVYRTKFREANLRNTKGWGLLSSDNDFSKADLRGANFRGMKYYQVESKPRFRGAIYDDDTTWPDGFDPKAAGAIMKPAEKKEDADASKEKKAGADDGAKPEADK